MSRRVRRDSETSTDSWSLVEEDRLDDDFSLNSTDNEIETEPIIEEPVTTDEEDVEEDTASEKSLDSESDDSEVSDLSENEEEEEEDVEEDLEEEKEDSEDSDLSDAESDVSVDISDEEGEEEEEDVEEEKESEEIDEIYEIGEGDEITARSEVEAALKCKEDMDWMYEEIGDMSDSPARKIIRVLFAFSLFLVLFPIAEIFTSWMLNVKLHRTPRVEYPTLVFDSYSPPSYNAEKRSFVYKTKEESETGLRQWRRNQKSNRNTLHLLEKILVQKPLSVSEEDQEKDREFLLKSFEILELFTNQTYTWKMQSEPRVEEIKKVDQKVEDLTIEYHYNQSLFDGNLRNLKNLNSRQKRQIFKQSKKAQCSALAPVPPAPFSPRKTQKLQYPRPCFVHVNQSKWTCQKSLNLPSVIYQQQPPNFTVLPRAYSIQKKQKAWGKTSSGFPKKQKLDICGKKASESMRTISKPTDTCHSRQLSKFSPRSVSKVAPRRIVHKAPLPCRIPTYKPSMPKKTVKPQEDWLQKRMNHRAQQRQRA